MKQANNKTKAVALAAVFALLIGIGATQAQQTDIQGVIRNTLSGVSEMHIEVRETGSSTCDVMPGRESIKDVAVVLTTTEDAYVYVVVKDSTKGEIKWEIAPGWTEITDQIKATAYESPKANKDSYFNGKKIQSTGAAIFSGTQRVFARTVSGTDSGEPYSFEILKDNKFTYPAEMGVEWITLADPAVSIDFQAYAVEKAPFGSIVEKWMSLRTFKTEATQAVNAKLAEYLNPTTEQSRAAANAIAAIEAAGTINEITTCKDKGIEEIAKLETVVTIQRGNAGDAIRPADVSTAKTEAWDAYTTKSLDGSSSVYAEYYDYSANTVLKYGDLTMKLDVTKIGAKPRDGYPVYIALHGGGGTTAAVNDDQWEQMKQYYKTVLERDGEGFLYIAARSITNTWKCHWEDQSFALYDKLIKYAILDGEKYSSWEIDPNRVYIEGYSAGGDGVYQITPRMADRFAAANMSAGHPNGVKLTNLRNVPFQMQMGELDNAYGRNYWIVRNDIYMDALQGEYGGFTHRAILVKDKQHSEIGDNNSSAKEIIKDNIKWLNSGDRTSETIGSNYAPYFLKNYKRDPIPQDVVWDLGTRAVGTNQRTVESFYYLTAPKSVNRGVMRASYNRSTNTVVINTKDNKNAYYKCAKDTTAVSRGDGVVWNVDALPGDANFGILLNEKMVDFSKPVTFMINGKKAVAMVVPDKQTLKETTEERGDPNFQFVAKVMYSDLTA